MEKVKITVMRRGVYQDLIDKYENPLENPCEMKIGSVYISENAQKPKGLCSNAWQTLCPFVEDLANGGGDFYDGWMKDAHSAMLTCNDGFRPVSFYIEVIK